MRGFVLCVLAAIGTNTIVAAGPAGPSMAAANQTYNPAAAANQSYKPAIASVLPTRGEVVGVAHPVVVTFTAPFADWLTIDRRSSWRRTSLLPLTAILTSHVHEWSTHRPRRTHRNTHRHRRTDRSTDRHPRTHRNRRTHRHRRTDRNTDERRRNRRNRPRQSQRNAGHLIDWRASRTARACCRRCTNGLARRRLDACVAATGWQRDGRNVRAQRRCDPAQPSPSSKYSDVESIKDRHRGRTLHLCSDIRIQVMRQSRMPYGSRG